MDIVGLLSWSAAALGVTTVAPQLVKLWRTRVTTGVSLRLWQMGVLGSLGWSAHGFITDNPALLWPSGLLVVLQALLVTIVSRGRGAPVLPALAAPAAGGVVLVVIDLVLGGVAFAAIITFAPMLGQLAQLRVMHKAADLFGVARGYLILNWLCQILWMAYAVPAVDQAMFLSAAVMSALCSLTLGYYVYRRLLLVRAAAIVPVRVAA